MKWKTILIFLEENTGALPVGNFTGALPVGEFNFSFRNTATATLKSKVCYHEQPNCISRKMIGQQHHAKIIERDKETLISLISYISFSCYDLGPISEETVHEALVPNDFEIFLIFPKS